MPIWDKVKQELDRAGQVAQDALDEGRIRLDAHRARQMADQAAEALGYAVYRARAAGAALDDAEMARHVGRLGEHEAEVTRLEAQLREIQQRWRTGASSTASAPAAGGATGSTGPDMPPSPTPPASGPLDVGPVGTASASAGMAMSPETSGGPVPPPDTTPPSGGVYGVVPPIDDVSRSAAETDKPTTDMWKKGDVMGHEPY
jgi:hypothetical protein